MSKTQEQLNAEYTPTLRNLHRFCGRAIQRTGRGAPEIEVYTTTILNIQTAWQRPSGTLETIVLERMQESIAFYQERLAALNHWTRSHLSDRVIYARQHTAYEDLWRRIDNGVWTLPPPILPLVFCLVIDAHRLQFSFDALFSALYHATVYDVRESCERGAFGKRALYAQTCPASYTKLSLAQSEGYQTLQQELSKTTSDSLVLLASHEQHEIAVVLHQHFPDVEFVYLPEPLPEVLL